MPVFLLAQAFGRWGNFFNQEAFGGIVNGYTTGPLTDAQLIAQRETLHRLLVPNFVINQMYVTDFRGLDIQPIAGYYYPTFYFESIANFLGFLVMMVPRRFTRKLYLGDGLPIYLTWYGITRFFIEGMRTDPLMLGNLRIARLTSVVFVIAGIAIFVLRRVFKYKLIPSYDIFYGEQSASIWLEGHPPVPKEKKNKQRIKMIANNRINNQTIKKAVIFDCDGTLLDTYGLIMKCTRKTFEIVFPDYPASDELIESFFGPLLDDSFRKITSDEAKVQEAISVYRKLVIDLHPEMVRSYPGINELVKALKKTGTYLAIVSNKVSEVIHLGLSINGIDEYFDLVLGAEKLAKPKPNPDGIEQVCRIFGVNKILCG